MRRMACTLIVLATAAIPVVGRAQVTEDNFQLHNTGDLVALCSAQSSDRLYTPAQNFCHGFAVGVYQTLVATQVNSRSRLFCPPATPTQSRTEAIAGFVAWAKASPTRLRLSPVDGIAGYLADKLPCTPAGKRR